MGKIKEFSNFIERIFESSQLQVAAGAIRKAFQEEIFLNADEIHKYLKNMAIVWENWKKDSGTDFINRFIEDKGGDIFINWLSNIFNFESKQLEVDCPRGPSSVDSILQISYNFSKDELKAISELLLNNGIETPEDEVARTLFLEAIKSISETFSKIIGQPYNIFTSEVNMTKKKGNLKIDYKGAGRVTQ